MNYRIHAAVSILILLLLFNRCQNKQKGPDDRQISDGYPSELRIGFASSNITPPSGMRLCGTFEERLSLGVHDSLFVRAFVFQQGEIKFTIAGCDLAMVFPEICDSVRNKVSEVGLRPDHVLIHGSETHNGPDYYGEFRDVFHDRAIKQYGFDQAEPIDYSAFLIDKISEAILLANKKLTPSNINFSSGECNGIAFNRRFRMKDGTVGWNPGKMNPEIIKPIGPIDARVPVLSIFRDDSSIPSAILTGFAMHLAILEDANYSADYPYYLSEKLRHTISSDLFVHFLQAPCCEVNHVDVSNPMPQTGHQWAKVVGEKLASSVTEILKVKEASVLPVLKVGSMMVPLELQEFSAEEIEKQRFIWQSPERVTMNFLEVVYAGKVTGIYDRHQGKAVNTIIQAFQFNDKTVLVGLPSEVSVELGLKIQEESPYTNTMIVQLSNDWFGYIPPKHMFDEGHYEAVVAKVRPHEGEKLANNAIRLLNEIYKK